MGTNGLYTIVFCIYEYCMYVSTWYQYSEHISTVEKRRKEEEQKQIFTSSLPFWCRHLIVNNNKKKVSKRQHKYVRLQYQILLNLILVDISNQKFLKALCFLIRQCDTVLIFKYILLTFCKIYQKATKSKVNISIFI